MVMKTSAISKVSRLLCFLGAIALGVALVVPLWRIELDAPQYPEGLVLLIYPHKLGGNVDIINGLNHYIGMETLHAENFIEFTILRYIIGAYAILFLCAGLVGKRKFLNIAFGAFVLFGIVAMVDFWRWEYNYGHNLDPNAAIIVPGMSYQPPLIGFKQLLNFGAYSVPDKGGWLFLLAGFMLLIAVLKEAGIFRKFGKKRALLLLPFLSSMLLSCGQSGPTPIKFKVDRCDHCKMTIMDARFAGEMITEKGRAYKFDDVKCMVNYINENPTPKSRSVWISAYESTNALLDATKAFYVKSEILKSPMGGNIAAFSTREAAEESARKFQTDVITWETLAIQ
jgi:copper chaperone NosL